MAVISDRRCNLTPQECAHARSHARRRKCHRGFTCLRGLRSHHPPQNLKSWLRHVSPDLQSHRHRQQGPTCQPVTSPQRGADTALSMPLIEQRSFSHPSPPSTPSAIICGLSTARHLARICSFLPPSCRLPPFIHSVPLVAADSSLSNAPAAASSSVIKRLRRIEIISIRARR